MRTENEQLKAEHALAARRMVMIERSNTVINNENIAYKKRIQETEAHLEKVQADYNAFVQKHNAEIARLTNDYNNLISKIKILEQSSGQKIQELSRLNKELQERTSTEIKKLNDEMKKMSDQFSIEREAIKKASAQTEYILTQKNERLVSINDDRSWAWD